MGGSARDQKTISVCLHVKYTTDYPDSVPELWVKEPQGLTADLVTELETEVKKLAKEREGEVRWARAIVCEGNTIHSMSEPI